MTLLSLQLAPLRIALRTSVTTAQGELCVLTGVRLRVQGGGHVGWGEAMPVAGRGRESAESIQSLLWQRSERGLTAPTGLDSIRAEVETLPEEAKATRAGLELALLDWWARHEGISVARLLSSSPRSEVAVNALLAAGELPELVDQALQALDAGYTTLKVKVAAAPLDVDLARLAALRNRVGPSVRLRVDANGGWAEPVATRALSELRALGVELCEQPVPEEDVEALERLARLRGCPVAADEAVPRLAQRSASSVGIWVLKPAAMGGLLAALRIGAQARARGIESYVTAGWEGCIARAGALHLAAALGAGDRAHGLATGDWIDGPEGLPRAVNGRMRIPEAPGLGFVPEGRP